MKRRKKLGAISVDKQMKVRRKALRSCDDAYTTKHDAHLKKPNYEERACRFGVDSVLQALYEEKEIDAVLGTFQSCAEKCPDGFERLVLKRDADDLPTVCACRLDPNTRKKFREEKYKKQTEKQRAPFGTYKKPVHLRRCIQFDEKGKKCIQKGLPGVELKKIRR